LVREDFGIVDLQQGTNSVDVRVVRVRDKDGAHVEAMLFHGLEQRSIEDARVHEHGISAVVGTNEIGVRETKPGKE
jgi:hypothetical protein